jgi:hypothetical protein
VVSRYVGKELPPEVRLERRLAELPPDPRPLPAVDAYDRLLRRSRVGG